MKQPQQLCVFLVLAITWSFAVPASAQINSKDQRTVDQISKSITRAGEKFKDEDFDASAKLIVKANKRLARLAEKTSAGELWDLLEKQHKRLSTARDLLVKKGVELDEIQPLPDPAAAPEQKKGISFVSQVAPLSLIHI